uniref:MAM domain-containing protein n=1 Tax=Emiliania huxleyi TaxID=2903 RepID=A0A7S3TW75_EMIHU
MSEWLPSFHSPATSAPRSQISFRQASPARSHHDRQMRFRLFLFLPACPGELNAPIEPAPSPKPTPPPKPTPRPASGIPLPLPRPAGPAAPLLGTGRLRGSGAPSPPPPSPPPPPLSPPPPPSPLSPPFLPPPPPSLPPLLPDMISCDFEVDNCAWIDTAPDGYSWTRTSGATTSYPRTGPSSDHTTGSGSYLYTEASGRSNTSSPRPLAATTSCTSSRARASSRSSRLSLQQDATLSFAYHMYGRVLPHDMGTLSIEAYDIETGWSTLWSRIGKQGAEWRDAAVVLPASATKVRFSGKTGSGWKSDMALDDVLFSQFAPPSPPPIPPPPPVTPPSPPFPPSPPLAPGFVATASEAELRSLITEAAASQANVSIYLPPSADFKMDSQISCGSDINVTVASSGEGATLDGQEQSGLFYLEGGCSLTLRGLILVNGRAAQGGVVYASGAGDVEIIDSDVRDCSAYTSGGVVSADQNSGAVSIRGSTVTGCSAGTVRRVELAALQRDKGCRGPRLPHTPLSPRNRSPAASSTRITAVRSR